jgi:hypothetical protein
MRAVAASGSAPKRAELLQQRPAEPIFEPLLPPPLDELLACGHDLLLAFFTYIRRRLGVFTALL